MWQSALPLQPHSPQHARNTAHATYVLQGVYNIDLILQKVDNFAKQMCIVCSTQQANHRETPTSMPCRGGGGFVWGQCRQVKFRDGKNFGTPSILVRGHQTQETSTPPNVKTCGLFCT